MSASSSMINTTGSGGFSHGMGTIPHRRRMTPAENAVLPLVRLEADSLYSSLTPGFQVHADPSVRAGRGCLPCGCLRGQLPAERRLLDKQPLHRADSDGHLVASPAIGVLGDDRGDSAAERLDVRQSSPV